MQGNPGEEGWGNMLSVGPLSEVLGRAGIGLQSQIVVYANPPTGWGEDGRLVWILMV